MNDASSHELRPPGGARGWNRRQRLRRTVVVLTGVTITASALGVWWWRRAQTPTYQPGERPPEITATLELGIPSAAPAVQLEDVTAAAGLGGFVTFAGARSAQLPEDMGGGLAFGDFDDDGDDDLFLVAAGASLQEPPPARAPSVLFENLGQGRFTPFAGFPALQIIGMGAAWGDADGDGRLDLVVSGYQTLQLYRNLGDRFERDQRFPEPPGFWTGVAWADFDLDGDLDLHVCGYVRYREEATDRGRVSTQYGAAAPFTLNPASYAAEGNLLLVNDGRGGFRDEALPQGVANGEGRSLSALWHDFDDDGRLDLYVANDVSDNVLYLNRADGFVDVSHRARVADYRGAMGLAAADWNRDGDDDLFVSHWLGQENALYDSLWVAAAGGGVRSGNRPPQPPAAPALAFMDLATPLGLGQVSLPMVGWGSVFADLDADGWSDLVVANGSTLEQSGEAPKRLVAQPSFLFWNERGERFHQLASAGSPLATPRVSRGLAASDVDLDGDLDLAIVDLDGGVRLLVNRMQRGHWLEVALRGRAGRGRGEGATVSVRLPDGSTLRRSVDGGGSYLGQSSPLLYFGLGSAAAIEAVEIHWPGGARQHVDGLTVDARWEIREGVEDPRRLGEAAPSVAVAAAAVPGAGTPVTSRREQVERFWQAHRAGMDALKREGDSVAAEGLFRQALAIDPRHEDARYYLAASLAEQGRPDEALRELAELVRVEPRSLRGHRQVAILLLATARSRADLTAAGDSIERALAINREDTGSLLARAELDLLAGDERAAEEHLAAICRTNPRAVGAFFLRASLAARRGDPAAARTLLEAAGAARGPDWKPRGAVAEGDVRRRMHVEEGPFARFWEEWDGDPRPEVALAALDAVLDERRRELR